MRKLFNRLEDWYMRLTPEQCAKYAGLISIFNIYVIFRIELRTLILMPAMYVLLGSAIAFGYIVTTMYRKGVSRNYVHFVALVLMPAILSVVFTLNYYIAFNSTKETYSCHTGWQYEPSTRHHHGSGRYSSNTLLYLEKGAYDDYPGIRVFVDKSQIKGSYITYTFADGIFGMRVMKDWEFSFSKE